MARRSGQPAPGDEDAAEQVRQVLHGLERLFAAWRTSHWREAAGGGLRPSQGACLAALERLGGRARMGELAAELGVTRASATALVGPLERRGLVRRAKDPEDGRSVIVALTEAGRRAVRRWGAAPRSLRSALEDLPEPERKALRAAMARIVARLIEDGLVARARMCFTCAYFERDVHPGGAKPHHCRYVDRPLADADLRLECPDHVPAAEAPPGD